MTIPHCPTTRPEQALSSEKAAWGVREGHLTLLLPSVYLTPFVVPPSSSFLLFFLISSVSITFFISSNISRSTYCAWSRDESAPWGAHHGAEGVLQVPKSPVEPSPRGRESYENSPRSPPSLLIILSFLGMKCMMQREEVSGHFPRGPRNALEVRCNSQAGPELRREEGGWRSAGPSLPVRSERTEGAPSARWAQVPTGRQAVNKHILTVGRCKDHGENEPAAVTKTKP